MKKSSLVWRFFDRIENDNKRCFAVLCKLCDTQYKFFGNTTNLRSHLINKHPLQWELCQTGTFEETSFRVEDDESNQSGVTPITSNKRRKYSKAYKDKNVRYSISVDDNSRKSGERLPKIEIQRVDVLESADVENDQNDTEEHEATFNLVRQLHNQRGSDEEWLEEEPYAHLTYEPKQKMVYRKIKREVSSSPPRRVSTFTPQNKKHDKSPIYIEQPTVRDEYSVFGEYIANKLRKFKVPRTRGNLQQLITTILWQAEYGTYNNPEAVKRVLMFMTQEPDQEQAQQVQDIETQPVTIEIPMTEEETPNQSVEAESLEAI